MLIIHKTAKISEIVVASFLDEFYFHDKHLFVGDSTKTPDIVISNNQMAIEVVCCELDATWDYIRLKKVHNWDKASSIIYSYDSDYEIVKKHFSEIIMKKNQKFRNGNYSGFRNDIYLAVESMRGCLDNYDFVAVKNALQEILRTTQLLFTKIFWLSRDAIYLIDCEKTQKLFAFNSNEYLSKIIQYERKHSCELSEYK